MSRANKAPFAANTQIACVSIDFRSYLLPLPKAMKLVELMSGAFPCERRFSRSGRYSVTGEKCAVEMVIVSRDQIDMPKPVAESITPALGYDEGA